MRINNSELDDDVKIASQLINEFLAMDPVKKSQLASGFIKSIIEPFLGKRDQFNKVLKLKEEISI